MWQPVPNFSTYEAEDSGDIRNKNTGKILKHSVLSKGTGIPVVSLVSNNKTSVFEVRFLIACTYLGVDIRSNPKPKIEYIDGNKYNNAVSNLRVKTTEDLDGEEWKPIPEFETSYAISNKGRVKRLERIDRYIRKDTGKEVERRVSENILKLVDSQGYFEVGLIEGSKTAYRRIHRMVATAFIPNPEGLPEVNHKNGNKHDNTVDNLEWCTRLQNVHHSIETGLRPPAKRTDRSKKEILCVETGERFKNARLAAEKFNLSYYYLMDCMHKGKECHGYTFKQVAEDHRIKCLDTGEVFNFLSEVKDKFGFDPSDSIKRRTCIHGWTFCYMKDNIQDEEAYLWECRNRYSEWGRAEKRWEENT